MRKRIFYVSFYDNQKLWNVFQNRTCSSAAVNLIDYVSSVMGKTMDVVLLSPSWTLNKLGVFHGRTIKYSNWLTVSFPLTIGNSFKVFSFLAKVYSYLWVLFQLILKVKKKEKVVVYHSHTLAPVIIVAKFLTGFELVLQVNEIYQNVENTGRLRSYFEKSIFSFADSFIFSTSILNDVVNPFNKKPFIVCSGVYRSIPITQQKYQDNKIHLVYSGIIDKIKLGAFLSVKLATKLKPNYTIHIIGFGSESDIKDLESLIAEMNKLDFAKVIFDGLKKGDEFNCYLQQCHIGLALQSPDEMFNETSFPSKIFTYLANGLQVVSVKSSSICSSSVSKSIYFGENNSLKSIAEAINEITIVDNTVAALMKLDLEFENQLNKLIIGKL